MCSHFVCLWVETSVYIQYQGNHCPHVPATGMIHKQFIDRSWCRGPEKYPAWPHHGTELAIWLDTPQVQCLQKMAVPKKLVFYLKKNIQMPQTEPSSHNPKRHHDGHNWVLVHFGIPIYTQSCMFYWVKVLWFFHLKGINFGQPAVKGYGHWKPKQSKNYMKANKDIFWRELPFSVYRPSLIIYICVHYIYCQVCSLHN